MNTPAQSLRVLYIEDNPVDADLTRRELARLAPEMRLEVVTTLAAAFERLSPKCPPFDVVLTDLGLPEGNGLEILAHVRQRELSLAVVIITGSGDEAAAVAALKAGADDYLVKRAGVAGRLPVVLTAAYNSFLVGLERRSRPLRVLYAEPNASDCDLTLRHLAQYAPHIRMEIVDSGRDVLARLPLTAAGGAPPFDVLLLDFRLSGLDALEVVKTIRRERGFDFPIVLVTGHGSEDVVVQALRLGVDDYVVKHDGYLRQLPSVLEKVQKQAELNASEERFRRLSQEFQGLLDAIPDNLMLLDRDFNVLWANRAVVGSSAIAQETLAGRCCHVLRYDRPTPCDECPVLQCFESGTTGETSVTRPDGQSWDIRAVPILDERGGVTKAIVLERDVTERKRAEEALRKSEERYRQIAKCIPDPIWTVDLSGRFTYVNAAVERTHGWTVEEILELSFRDTNTPEQALKITARLEEELTKATSPQYDHNTIIFLESEQLRKDGSTFWAENSAAFLWSDDGNPVGLIGVTRDITERKRAQEALQKSEERLNLALEAAQDGIWDWNVKTGTIYSSPRFYTMLGYEPDEFGMTYDAWRKLVHPNDIEAAEDTLKKVLQRMADDYSIEFRMKAKDESYRWILGKGKAVEFAEDGTILRMVGTNSDITERRKLEEQLRHAQKMEAIASLSGGIAHDFNNILTGIIGFAELLSMFYRGDDSQVRNHTEQILNAGYRAKDLVRRILTIARQVEQEKTPVRLDQLIREVLKFLRASVSTTIELRLVINCPEGSVFADPTQIHQILMNLCTNAVHAMKDTGGVLGIGLDAVQLDARMEDRFFDLAPGPYLKMVVSDTGHGMSEQVMEKIFDPYFTTKKLGEGTGLGLAVVHGIVKDHGGAITVHSASGKGATFEILLPRLAAKAEDFADKTNGLLPRGTERILFVDDEDSIVSLSKLALENLGYDVVGETSSTRALETFSAQPDRFDLVITDLTMPGMTGVKLAEELLRIRADVPIILCSGFSMELAPEELQKTGIRHLLKKPVSIRHLAETVRKVLDQSS